MKSKYRVLTVLICIVVCSFSLVACNRGKATLLGAPQKVVALEYDERINSEFVVFKNKAEKFAAAFSSSVFDTYKSENNFAVSPISVYMALSLAAECADGDTRTELLSALGISYEELQKNFPTLYRSLAVERKSGNKTSGVLNLTNSIWLNKGTPVKQPCIDELSNRYYTYSYSADFENDNANANKAVRQFIKDQTQGLIDKDFRLSEETLFVILNTLYLKTVWNAYGDDLPFTQSEYAFVANDGSVTQQKFLQGYYNAGKVAETESYSTFFTSTYDGYKIKFMLPKDGYSINDIFTAENISAVNAISDYDGYDEENDIYYETRCLFPEYKCSYSDDVQAVLKEKFGVNKLFINPDAHNNGCDFSSLSEAHCFCDSILHVTDLTVDRKGIEGAAITVLPGATSSQPAEVRSDFILNRAFGFIITDSQNITLFSGVVNKI